MFFDDYYTTNSATLNNLDEGATYTIYVCAWNLNGDKKSEAATTTVTVSMSSSSQPAVILPPIGFKVTTNTGGAVGLQWEKVNGAYGYILQYKSSTATVWTDVDYTTATTFTITGLNQRSKYDFRVCAYSERAGFSDYIYLYGVSLGR